MLVGMNDREASRLMSVAVGLCRQRQNETVFDAATSAYGAMRAMYDLPSCQTARRKHVARQKMRLRYS